MKLKITRGFSAFLLTSSVYHTLERCFQGPVIASVRPDFRLFKNIVLQSGENEVPGSSCAAGSPGRAGFNMTFGPVHSLSSLFARLAKK